MPDRTFYPDLRVEYECRGDRYVAQAEWRADPGYWVCENDQWTVRLKPTTAAAGGVDPRTRLFNRESKRRMRRCRDALVAEAREMIKTTR